MTEVFNEEHVRQALRKAIGRGHGNQARFADIHSIYRPQLCVAMSGHAHITPKMAAAVGYEKVTVFVKKGTSI